ncbi:hypothetical protein WAB17_11180 [Parerythrobacter aurantius]|uniref:hypothetical protein n=1 Tax=Parerythrobacter aurantius TaxID=3127706 RepID=UPI003249222C
MQNPVVRGVAATLAGMLVAMLAVGVVEMVGHAVFPPPAGIDVTNPEDQARLMAAIPLGAKISVMLAWFVGALAGNVVATWIGRSIRPGWVVTGVLVLGGLYTTQMFPHPWWMVAGAIILPIVGKIAADRLLVSRLGD